MISITVLFLFDMLTWRGQDAHLAHSTAEHFAQSVDAVNEMLGPSNHGASWRT